MSSYRQCTVKNEDYRLKTVKIEGKGLKYSGPQFQKAVLDCRRQGDDQAKDAHSPQTVSDALFMGLKKFNEK